MGNDDERRDPAVAEERVAQSSLEGPRRTVVPPSGRDSRPRRRRVRRRLAALVRDAAASLGPDCACPSPCQMVTEGEDEQSVEHVKRSQPTRIKLRVGE
jgi:hypothetical protein